MAVIDVGMGSTRTGRFDRVIPTIGLVQVGQGPAEEVVHALARSGDEGDTLPKQGRFRELACLRTPAADGRVVPRSGCGLTEARGEGSPRMADIRFALRSPGQIPAAAPPPFGGAGCAPATGDLLLCQPA